MSIDLKDAVVLITGASRGIGVEMAVALAAEGAKLALAARSADKLDAVREQLVASGATAIAIPTDVSDDEALQRLVDQTETELGPIDVLINNAGVESVDYLEQVSADEVRKVLDINVVAVIRLTQMVLPGMKKRNRGHIVNIASFAGLVPTPFGEVYSASKHAVVGFSKSLRVAMKLDDLDIGVSMICPGYISKTGMYWDMKLKDGVSAPRSMGTTPPRVVTQAVLSCIRYNQGDVILNPGLPRTMVLLTLAFPRVATWVGLKLGMWDFQHQAARKRSHENSV